MNLLCVLKGHQDFKRVNTADSRLFVECYRCGRETSGIGITHAPYGGVHGPRDTGYELAVTQSPVATTEV